MLKRKQENVYNVSRVGWRFSFSDMRTMKKFRLRKYYPTLTQKQSDNETKARADLSLALITYTDFRKKRGRKVI